MDSTFQHPGRDLDEFAATLLGRYPDDTHERRLHWERDLEAEQRYEDALDSLIELLVEAAVNDVLRDQAAGGQSSQTT